MPVTSEELNEYLQELNDIRDTRALTAEEEGIKYNIEAILDYRA